MDGGNWMLRQGKVEPSYCCLLLPLLLLLLLVGVKMDGLMSRSGGVRACMRGDVIRYIYCSFPLEAYAVSRRRGGLSTPMMMTLMLTLITNWSQRTRWYS